MKFLLEYDFTEEEIENLSVNVPPVLLEQLFNSYKLVSKNIEALKEFGITAYKEIFKKYYDMFLMDNSNFLNIFKKYDLNDLVEKLNSNIEIIEFL